MPAAPAKAEFQSRSAHPVGGIVGPPRPDRPARCAELNPDRRDGCLPAIDAVAVRPGTDSDMRDVAQPIGRLTKYADAVGDVLPCAQVSMIRALSDEAVLIGGPNQGTRRLGSN